MIDFLFNKHKRNKENVSVAIATKANKTERTNPLISIAVKLKHRSTPQRSATPSTPSSKLCLVLFSVIQILALQFSTG